MPPIPNPEGEQERLQGLHQLQVLDTPAEARFDRLTRLALRVFRLPLSMITMVDAERQWFKSAQGHLFTATPRAESFCAQTVLQDSPLVVEDASVDERFFDHPAVVGDLGVRFYAGLPLRDSQGLAVGTFCILDSQPRQLSNDDLLALRDLAACAESELHLLKLSQSEQELLREMDDMRRTLAVDGLTRCWTRDSLMELLDKEGRQEGLAVLIAHLEGLREINDYWGQTVGDQALRMLADRCRTGLRPQDILGRLSGTRLVILSRCPTAQIQAYAQFLRQLLGEELMYEAQPLRIEVSMGVALRRGPVEPALDLLARAEKAQANARRGAGLFVAV